MKKYTALLLLAIMVLSVVQCGKNPQEKEMVQFIETYLEKIKPLHKKANLAYWEAAITGKEEAYERYSRLNLKIKKIHSDSADFAQLKSLKESGKVQEPLLRRQLDVMYNNFLTNQMDSTLLKKIVEKETAIEQKFSTFRGTIDGKKVTSNDIRNILKEETDSRKRMQAWQASKQVGAVVADDIIEVVKLRNQGAQQLGFPNFHTMRLKANEQDVEDISRLFSELDSLTETPFTKIKAELDSILAKKYGVGVAGLMPWHYHDPFFQETPLVYDIDLDTYYKDHDIVKLSREFYRSIGLPVEAILDSSDLYEREGKNPHAFCTDIDSRGDVRILCNVKNNEQWMETMLHELGHGVYDFYMDMDTPYILREPAHAFTTEGVAMFFGRLSRNANWMQEMLGLSDDERYRIAETANKYAQLKQLIFARWAMVMFNFEKALYENPDQDVRSLWWKKVERYQKVQKPAGRDKPDWAAKIHFTLAPCYYHNYLMGELFASQLHHYIVYDLMERESDAGVSYVESKQTGNFLRSSVFEVGKIYPWNEMIERATGEPLQAQYFVGQFVK